MHLSARSTLCGSTALILSILGAQQALAEEASDGPTTEVVVKGQRLHGYGAHRATTATKTDTPLIDVPQTIQVVTGEVIRDTAARDLYDVARNVSGVTQTTSYWGQNTGTFNIRGFSLNTESGYLKDGFRYFAEGTIVLGNVDHVEILKGPASVLYGRAEPGGIANIVTKTPKPDFGGELTVSGGSWDAASVNFGVTGALNKSQTLTGRIDAEYSSANSFRDTVWSRTLMLAPQIMWQPDADTIVRLRAEYVDDKRRPDYGVPSLDGNIAAVPISTYYGEPFDRQSTNQLNVLLSTERRLNEYWLIRAGLSYFNLKYDDSQDVFSSWLDGGTLERYYEYYQKYTTFKTAQTEAVGKFDTFGLKHIVLLGAEYDIHTNGPGDHPLGSINEAPIDILNPQHAASLQDLLSTLTTYTYTSIDETKAWAFYAQDQIDLTEKWKLLIGGRYDQVEEKGRYDYSAGGYGVADYGYRSHALSPRTGLLYKVTSGLSLFASASRSFTPNYAATDAITGETRTYKPTIGTQIEAGVKYEASNGRFNASSSIFQIERTNVLQTDPDNPNLSVQDGMHRSRGIEVDVAGQPIDNFSIVGAYAYTDAIVAESRDYPVGAMLPNAARHTASVWMSYGWKLKGGDKFTLGGGGSYQSKRPTDSENTLFMPAYAKFDAMLALEHANWRLAFNIENLTDKRYYTSSTGYGSAVIYPGRPRNFTVTLSKRF